MIYLTGVRATRRHIALARSAQAILSRHVHDDSQSAKISCVPFELSPSSAREVMYARALMYDYSGVNVLLAALSHFLGWPGLVKSAEDVFGFKPYVKIKQFKAIYWPLWMCDTAFTNDGSPSTSSRLSLTGLTGGEVSGTFTAKNVCFPGNSYAPLAYLPTSKFTQNVTIPEDLPIYDSTVHLRQLGNETPIVPVNFTVSPTAYLEKIKEILETQKWGKMSIRPSNWTEQLTSFYPILMPMYVGEIEVTSRRDESVVPGSFPVVVMANDSRVRDVQALASSNGYNSLHLPHHHPLIRRFWKIYKTRKLPKQVEDIKLSTQINMNIPPQDLPGNPSEHETAHLLDMNKPLMALGTAELSGLHHELLMPYRKDDDTFPPSETRSAEEPITWRSSMIRPWGSRRENLEFITRLSELYPERQKEQVTLETLSRQSGDKQLANPIERRLLERQLDQMRATIKATDQYLEEIKPAWWKR